MFVLCSPDGSERAGLLWGGPRHRWGGPGMPASALQKFVPAEGGAGAAESVQREGGPGTQQESVRRSLWLWPCLRDNWEETLDPVGCVTPPPQTAHPCALRKGCGWRGSLG